MSTYAPTALITVLGIELFDKGQANNHFLSYLRTTGVNADEDVSAQESASAYTYPPSSIKNDMS